MKLLLILLLGGAWAALGSDTLTLAEVLREVRSQNPTLRAARARAQASRHRAPQERAWEDPVLTAETSIAGMQDMSLKLEQRLPLSGRNLSRGRAASARALQAEARSRGEERDAERDARIAFHQYAAAHALLALNTRTGETLRQVKETARARYEAGGKRPAEVLAAEAEEASNQEARVDLETALEEARTTLNRLMQHPPGAPLPPPDPRDLEPPRASAAPPNAIETNPGLAASKAAVEEAKSQLELARRERIPDPSAGLSARRFTERGERMSEAMLEISIPLPWAQPGRTAAAVAEARANLAAAGEELRATRAMLEAEAKNAARKAEAYRHHLHLLREKILPLLAEALNASRLGYETGELTLPEILTAQRRLYENEAAAIRHRLELQTALAQLRALAAPEGAQPF